MWANIGLFLEWYQLVIPASHNILDENYLSTEEPPY